ARWTTASGATSRTTSGKLPSARSPRWSAPGASGSPASRGHGPAPRTSPCTTCPAPRSAAATTGPAKPAMPVTKTRIAPSAALQALQVGAHHHLDQLAEGDARRPAEHAPRLGGVAHQALDLGGAEQRRVPVHVLAPLRRRGDRSRSRGRTPTRLRKVAVERCDGSRQGSSGGAGP